jgi:hypothetical protein
MRAKDPAASPRPPVEQFAHPQHPAIQRCAADLHARFAFQDCLLPVKRKMIAILGDHRLNHHRIAGQAFFHDARLQLRHRDAGALSTHAFFALGDAHEPTCRLVIQLFTFVVADDRGFPATSFAVRICAPNHLLHARQILRQWPPARMWFAFWGRPWWQWFAARFGLHLFARGAGLNFGQQFQLQIA